jgi:hypothetical protein
VKIYAATVKALKKKERQGETEAMGHLAALCSKTL